MKKKIRIQIIFGRKAWNWRHLLSCSLFGFVSENTNVWMTVKYFRFTWNVHGMIAPHDALDVNLHLTNLISSVFCILIKTNFTFSSQLQKVWTPRKFEQLYIVHILLYSIFFRYFCSILLFASFLSFIPYIYSLVFDSRKNKQKGNAGTRTIDAKFVAKPNI